MEEQVFEKFYDNVTKKKWERVKAAAWDSLGMVIDKPMGHFTTYGITVRWGWYPISQALEIRVLESVMIGKAEALAQLDQFITACLVG
jgi:hypothetical protein